MKTYLYRAVATVDVEPEGDWDIGIAYGESLGRQTGYLSRSSAVEAGRKSGVPFKIVRSQPVVFIESGNPFEEIQKLSAALSDALRKVSGGWRHD